jgi:hypothetical protein
MRRDLTGRNYTTSLCGSSLRFLIRGLWALSENVVGKCTCLKVLILLGGTVLTIDEFEAAQNDFFESFRNYDEAGSLQQIEVLKYFVLANMLMESDIDPFSSQETKPYFSPPPHPCSR